MGTRTLCMPGRRHLDNGRLMKTDRSLKSEEERKKETQPPAHHLEKFLAGEQHAGQECMGVIFKPLQ